jgi:hypothetical protein
MEGYGNLKDEISTASHSRLGNPKKQDFHKCLDPKKDPQLKQRCYGQRHHLERRRKKRKTQYSLCFDFTRVKTR